MSNADIIRQQWPGIQKNIKDAINNDFLQKSYAMARGLISQALKEYRYHDVTGNTTNSFVIAFYLNHQLKGYVTSAEMLSHPASRPTLRKGKMYNLPEYWDGTSVKGLGRPYRAETGSREYYGKDEAERFVRVGTSFGGWSFLIAVTTDYASYIEMSKGLNVLSSIRTLLASSGAQVSMMKSGG